MDIGGDALSAADRSDGPYVVDMTVREQDRGRPEPVLGEDLLDTGHGVLARIDDHALLSGSGRDDIAVRGERPCWEPCDEHKRPFSRYGVSGYRGDPHGGEPITKGTGTGIWKVRFASDRELCGGSGGCPRASTSQVSRSAVYGFVGLPPVNTSVTRKHDRPRRTRPVAGKNERQRRKPGSGTAASRSSGSPDSGRSASAG